ncbi:MAG: site-specific integrase [Candidatus Bathyarchaeia archaeon]
MESEKPSFSAYEYAKMCSLMADAMKKVAKEIIQRLNMLPKKTEYVFKSSEKTTEASLKISFSSNFFKNRKKIAYEYQNPRLRQISFHTLRHWKATMEYHKTRDILHVKEMLGHTSLDNTLIYITLEKALYGTDNTNEFHSATAKTTEEAAKLIETGFEYVCTTPEGIMLFRKRK